jgi:hypothetical protein
VIGTGSTPAIESKQHCPFEFVIAGGMPGGGGFIAGPPALSLGGGVAPVGGIPGAFEPAR